LANKPTKITVNRSAATGRFVTEKYADSHKRTTETEHYRRQLQRQPFRRRFSQHPKRPLLRRRLAHPDEPRDISIAVAGRIGARRPAESGRIIFTPVAA